MKNKYLYSKLYSIMRKNKDSQVTIGNMMGVSDLTIRKKLAGKTDWTISEIEMLCDHYKMNYYELFEKE